MFQFLYSVKCILYIIIFIILYLFIIIYHTDIIQMELHEKMAKVKDKKSRAAVPVPGHAPAST